MNSNEMWPVRLSACPSLALTDCYACRRAPSAPAACLQPVRLSSCCQLVAAPFDAFERVSSQQPSPGKSTATRKGPPSRPKLSPPLSVASAYCHVSEAVQHLDRHHNNAADPFIVLPVRSLFGIHAPVLLREGSNLVPHRCANGGGGGVSACM